MWATRKNHYRVVEYLTLQGADIDAVDGDGFDIVMYAAQAGGEHILQLLLDEAVAYDLPCKSGTTALAIAASNGHAGCVQKLLGCLICRGCSWTGLPGHTVGEALAER